MNMFIKRFLPASKRNAEVILKRCDEIEKTQKDILLLLREQNNRLCSLERVLVDGQMKEALVRLQNIEQEMVERLRHIEEKEESIMEKAGSMATGTLRIKVSKSDVL